MSPQALDVYSVGVILWHLWFKQVPFIGKGNKAIIDHVLRGKRQNLKGEPGPGPRSPPPPRALASLIERCWEQEPSKRPTMAQVLEHFVWHPLGHLPGDSQTTSWQHA